jgi:hypothetical protein
MHKEESGFFLQHVAMHGSHLNARLSQSRSDGINFAGQQDDVPGDMRSRLPLAESSRL